MCVASSFSIAFSFAIGLSLTGSFPHSCGRNRCVVHMPQMAISIDQLLDRGLQETVGLAVSIVSAHVNIDSALSDRAGISNTAHIHVRLLAARRWWGPWWCIASGVPHHDALCGGGCGRARGSGSGAPAPAHADAVGGRGGHARAVGGCRTAA